MPSYKVRGTGQKVTLDKSTFRAKGGEGEVHILGSTVYKVCEPGKMIPDGKFQELAVLKHPRIVVPDAVLLDSHDDPCGYTMKAVPGNAKALATILTKTYREREGVSPTMMAELVSQIAEGLRYIHKHPGYLQVDGNELNYMVTGDHREVYFIDTNSFQTPHYPADAIMASIRDWTLEPNPKTKQYPWSQDTDWFSFAIISFYMFCGIHPFKGRHPKFPDLKTAMADQIRAGVSVLDPETMYPKAAVYSPFEDFIPGGASGAYMQWYRAVLCDKKRLPAPIDFQSVAALGAIIKQVVGSNQFDMKELRAYDSRVIGYVSVGGKEVVVTKKSVYVNGQQRPRPADSFRVGFTPVKLTPVACYVDDHTFGVPVAYLHNLETQTKIPFDFEVQDIMSCEGRLYLLSFGIVYEVVFSETGAEIVAMTQMVANVMRNATRLYQGVAFQDMFGATYASVFPAKGRHHQIKLAELDGFEITDAKFESGVMMALGTERTTGQNNRFVFVFSEHYDAYDCRTVENVMPTGINFTVLDTGNVVSLTEEEKIEVFSRHRGKPAVKSISDPAIEADMRLCHFGSQVRFAHGEKLYSFAMRK